MVKTLILALCAVLFISAVSSLTISPSAAHLSASDATEDKNNFNKWAATINDAAEDKNNHHGAEDKADAQAWHHRWWDMVEDRNMGSPEDKATIAHWMDFREDGKTKLWGKATAAAGPL